MDLMPFRRGLLDVMNIDAIKMDASKIDVTIIYIINTVPPGFCTRGIFRRIW